MTTFDSTKRSLPELLKDITNGKIQLPDFQRGWVWDDRACQKPAGQYRPIFSGRCRHADGNGW